jgi:uncharacterized integral membrane protein
MADDQDTTPTPAARSVPATSTGADTQASSTGSTTASVEPKQVRLDPSLDGHQRQGISGATWLALILGTVILVLLLIFILQNNEPAEFAFLGFGFSLPLGVAMLFAAIAGVLITALLGSVRLFKVSRRVRKLEKEREHIRQALR